MDCSPPVTSVHRIFQARILEWIAIPFSRESSPPRDWSWVSCIAGNSLSAEPPGLPEPRAKDRICKMPASEWFSNQSPVNLWKLYSQPRFLSTYLWSAEWSTSDGGTMNSPDFRHLLWSWVPRETVTTSKVNRGVIAPFALWSDSHKLPLMASFPRMLAGASFQPSLPVNITVPKRARHPAGAQ